VVGRQNPPREETKAGNQTGAGVGEQSGERLGGRKEETIAIPRKKPRNLVGEVEEKKREQPLLILVGIKKDTVFVKRGKKKNLIAHTMKPMNRLVFRGGDGT